mgnify:CR=1 FL=1
MPNFGGLPTSLSWPALFPRCFMDHCLIGFLFRGNNPGNKLGRLYPRFPLFLFGLDSRQYI